MAPIASIRALAQRAAFNLHLPSSEFKDQLTNPGDVFSVLLILGGDVVGRALAQLAGTGLTPVTFSFGAPAQFSCNFLTWKLTILQVGSHTL